MDKNCCAIAGVAPPQDSVLKKASDLLLRVWSGADPATRSATSTPRPGPVLHRLPDLRKFGPSLH